MPESYRKKAVLVPYSELFNSCCKRRRAFAEIYGRNPRENPCLIPKRKNRCFRIKSLLGAERMPQGQYNTNAAGIGEQSVNTGSPRAAAGASPLRRRSPGGFLGGFSGQVQRVYPARLWRGHLSPFWFGFRLWAGSVRVCVYARVYGWSVSKCVFIVDGSNSLCTAF